MGGTAGGACQIYVLRNGIFVCAHSKPKYDWLIANTGTSFKLWPINGVLSSLDASAGTHSRYGACDLNGNGYSPALLTTVAKQARDKNFLAWPRLWKNADGSSNWHIHMADADCPHMAVTLAAQFALFAKGYDGLVDNNPDPLGRYRQAEIMAAFNAKPAPPAPAPAPKPAVTTVPVKTWTLPYTYRTGWYPYPGKQGASYYGPSVAGNPWYSGKTAGGSNAGSYATGGLTLAWVRAHIQRIQRRVGVGVDGIYGQFTVLAVKKWQAAHGLTPDGVVGPRTWAAMAKASSQ